MMKTVIAITGQKGSGKDTLAHFIRMNNPTYVKYAFADPVRDAAKAFFGWTDIDFTPENKEKIDPYWGISPRQALQFIGTEVGRIAFAKRFPAFAELIGDRIWIHRFFKFLETLGDEDNCVVSDVRFHNELDAVDSLKRRGYGVIKLGVIRPGASGDGHASESEVPELLDKCDFVFLNETTVEDLYNFTFDVLRPLGIV